MIPLRRVKLLKLLKKLLKTVVTAVEETAKSDRCDTVEETAKRDRCDTVETTEEGLPGKALSAFSHRRWTVAYAIVSHIFILPSFFRHLFIGHVLPRNGYVKVRQRVGAGDRRPTRTPR